MLNKFQDLENKTVKIKQIKGERGREKSQRATLIGLGLKGIGSEVSLKITKPVYGMLYKIKHLVEVGEQIKK